MNTKKLKNHDWLITIIAIIIQIIGIFVIFSTTYNPANATQLSDETIKQIIFFIIGLIIYFGLSQMDISWLNNKTIILILYFLIIALLIYVRFFGENIANTNRWIRLGFFSFQPSEAAKLVTILISAFIFYTKETIIVHRLKSIKYISKLYNKAEQSFPQFILIIDNFILILPILLLILIQPALGNTVIIFLLWLLTIYTVIPERNKVSIFIFITAIFFLLISQFIDFKLVGQEFNILPKDIGDISYTIIILLAILLT